MISSKMRVLILAATLAASLTVAKAGAQSFEEDSRGVPSIMGKALPKESFLRFKARLLKNPTVAWRNDSFFREKGYPAPPEITGEELDKIILNEHAYRVPRDNDDPSAFLDVWRYFYASLYGGEGTGEAQGDGRNGIAGKYQNKGIGKTPAAPLPPAGQADQPDQEDTAGKSWLGSWWVKIRSTLGYQAVFDKISDLTHSSGGVPMTQGIVESIWGEITNRELPEGGNRVVAVIVTGLIDQFGQPLIIVVRENAVRPAHYMTNLHRREANYEDEIKRVSALFPYLLESLPHDTVTSGSDRDRLRGGVFDLVDRISKTYAAEYALSFFHGASSPSNIEITGKAIDHSSMTALDGFTEAKFADDEPNGDLRAIKIEILNDFVDDLRKTVPKELVDAVPTVREVSDRLKHSYGRHLEREMLWLAGSPSELLDHVVDQSAARKLGRLLREIAKAGNDTVRDSRYYIPQKTGIYDFAKILRILARDDGTDPEKIKKSLKKEISDTKLASELAGAYSQYVKELTRVAANEGIQAPGLRVYMLEAAQKRNKKLVGLMRGPEMWAKEVSRILSFEIGKDPQAISKFINKSINENSRTYPHSLPYTVVLSQWDDPETGNIIQKVYDAKTSKYGTVVMAELTGSSVNFFGRRIKSENLRKSSLSLEIDGQNIKGEKVVNDPKLVAYKFPDFNTKREFKVHLFRSASRGGGSCEGPLGRVESP